MLWAEQRHPICRRIACVIGAFSSLFVLLSDGRNSWTCPRAWHEARSQDLHRLTCAWSVADRRAPCVLGQVGTPASCGLARGQLCIWFSVFRLCNGTVPGSQGIIRQQVIADAVRAIRWRHRDRPRRLSLACSDL